MQGLEENPLQALVRHSGDDLALPLCQGILGREMMGLNHFTIKGSVLDSNYR